MPPKLKLPKAFTYESIQRFIYSSVNIFLKLCLWQVFQCQQQGKILKKMSDPCSRLFFQNDSKQIFYPTCSCDVTLTILHALLLNLWTAMEVISYDFQSQVIHRMHLLPGPLEMLIPETQPPWCEEAQVMWRHVRVEAFEIILLLNTI